MRNRTSLHVQATIGLLVSLVFLLPALFGDLTLGADDPAPASISGIRDNWREIPEVREALAIAGSEGCETCHGDIENATENMGFTIACTFCHGGDPVSTVKEIAHVQPRLPVIADQTTPPLDYDLPYQRFVNPSNLRVVADVCGHCHVDHTVIESLMATAAGHYAGGLYLSGVVDTKTPVYGTFAIEDIDGDVPIEDGAVAELLDLITYDPGEDPSLYSTHFRAVPGQACARCHLWSRGKGYRGAVGADGVYRADGCAACHMPYANDGLSQSADSSIDHVQQGHPKDHTITKAIPTEQCLHCHHRGARIGLSYTGRAQMPPRLPSGPGVVGTTDEIFNSNYHYTDPATNPPDVHMEQGMDCIDCHVPNGIMGDDNVYGHMDQATKTECRQCHGTPDELGSMHDHDSNPLKNVSRFLGVTRLTSKVTGQLHIVNQVKDLVDHTSPSYNFRASCAMNENHVKDEGGLECYACHASWTPNCFGCHFERDEQQMGLNLVTRQWEVGKVSTNNKVFESFKHFAMGYNRENRVAPYIVGCQVVADVTAPDGSKVLDFVMPETTNGLSGLGLQPVNPHTIRGAGDVRGCAECHRSPTAVGLGSGSYSIARDHAFLVASGGVQVYDRKTDPAAPTLVDTLSVTGPKAVAVLPDIVEGTADYLYVAGSSGLDIFDMQSGIPVSPVGGVGGIDVMDVDRAARYLYAVVGGIGVNVYDNQDPTQAVYVTTIPIPTAQRVKHWGIHLFVAAGPAGLVVVDIRDNTAPVVVRTVPGMDALDVALYAHHQKGEAFAARAYVADPGFGVRVVDLLPDYESATLIGGFALPGAVGLDTYTSYVEADATTPSREHDYLYVAAGASGLRVLDITVPAAISEIAAVTDLGGLAVDVDVASDMKPPGVDDHAMVANSSLGLQIVDVTDPQNPSLVTTLAATGALSTLVEVQQLDRFIDEQGNELKENSHPDAGPFDRADLVRILSTPIAECVLGGCCQSAGTCAEMSNSDCSLSGGAFGGDGTTCADTDLDGVGEACDCAPANDQLWTLPGQAQGLLLSHTGGAGGTTTLDWAAPSEPGGVLVLYDTVVSTAADDFGPAVCVAANETDTQAQDTTPPDPGQVLFFLVRAENGCGLGSAGQDSAGLPRSVPDCL